MSHAEKPLRPLALVVLDGWGIDGAKPDGDATELASPPTMKRLRATCPVTQLDASGLAVGLPPGVIGNSEVGHMNLGAGRVVFQDLAKISKAITDGDFFRNEVLGRALRGAAERGGAVHLLGLWSDAGVHSHVEHAYALVQLARQSGVGRVYLHAFTDGRDSDPRGGLGYLTRFIEVARDVEAHAPSTGGGSTARIASVSGRYFAMDRDKRWERVKLAWDAIVHGRAPLVDDPIAAVRASYDAGKTDEFVEPFCVRGSDDRALATVQDGDAVIFFNFRSDRGRQLTQAFTQPDFAGFDRGRVPRVDYVTMTRYDPTFTCPFAFAPQSLDRILGAVLADRGLSQLRVAETEKYAHVTYFFNGGIETPFPREERIMVPSAKEVATYDLLPEMRAKEITDETIARLEKGPPLDFVLLNYANADMVGHSGKLEPTCKAVRTVDTSLGRLIEALERKGYVVLVTADHGNAEQMIDPESGEPHTAHTTNPVPFILYDAVTPALGAKPRALRAGGKLGDVAPTILSLMGLQQPAEMGGRAVTT